MLKLGIRKFTSTAYRTAEIATKVDMVNQYGAQLAKAQGHVNGFVGGKYKSPTGFEKIVNQRI